ncbi:DUF523 domain-containing protein [Oleidesulfovibrio sp.]|uniref:DUF523 domain-containing protein n=1 Tax=Oleidesulfovibrio sp. TaxID=2909707 RepID=UPI003A89DC58
MRYIVSACLAGVCCRYDGKSKPHERVLELIKSGQALPVCPEQLGGLPTPRGKAEMKNDRIYTESGEDVTEQFTSGAQQALELAQLFGAQGAILQSRSPSCGATQIYDGSFTGSLITGSGVFASLLRKHNFMVQEDTYFS